MSETQQSNSATTRRVSLRNLFLDPNNFRLIHEPLQVDVPDAQIKDPTVCKRTYRLILGKNNQSIQDLIDSFKANGFLPVDQIQVRPLEDGGFVVIEGNRRIAALKFLQHEYNSKAIDLGNLKPAIFSSVPVVLYEDNDPVHYLTLMGLKHISGNRKWGEWNQAKHLETLIVKHKLAEDDVCKSLGIAKVELRRNLKALSLVNQYIQSDYGDQFDQSLFPIFREVVRKPALKNWLDWQEESYAAKNTENSEIFFSWLSREPKESEDTEDHSIGDQDFYDPVITKRDDIRLLAEIVKDPTALAELKSSRNLNDAHRSSNFILDQKVKDAVRSLGNDVLTLTKLSIPPEHVPQLEQALGKLRGTLEKARNFSQSGGAQHTVYFDRVDHHFSSIKVTNYRGISGLEIQKLSQVNLFAGLNNSGKTSLLEAIYLLCKQNDFNGLVEVLRRRGKIPEDHIPPKWLAEQLNESIELEGHFDGKPTRMTLDPFEEQGTFDRTSYLKSVDIIARFDQNELEARTRMYQGRDFENQAESIKQLCKTVFSSPFFLNEPQHYTAYYHKSVQSKALQKIFDFLRQAILPTLKDIRLVDEFQRFLVNDDQFPDSIDLTSYGEGLQRVFFTSLIFASAAHGVVLIDEFENAIHTNLIKDFVPFIYKLAKEFNIQVFLTSHSKECIDAFVEQVGETTLADFSFHALVRDHDNTVTVRAFDGPTFSKLLTAGDVDLRRAR